MNASAALVTPRGTTQELEVPVPTKRTTTSAERACETCGSMFAPRLHDVQRGHGRYCSRSCFYTDLKRQSSERRCTVDECDRRIVARGFCGLHYQRWNRCGDPLGAAVAPASERLANQYLIDEDTGCWLWRGSLNKGYGSISVDGIRRPVHRYSYELTFGPVDPALDIDHLCRNRECVNPSHLEPVTRRENILRGHTLPAVYAARSHCSNGHEYTEESTLWIGNERKCRSCARERRQAKK